MSSLNSIDSQDLVSSKENIQPLRRGRNASILCTALQAETDSEAHQELEKQRNEFEIKLRSNTSEDPLVDWCAYIHWIEQSFPKQAREGKLNVVLQKCINKFKDCDKYMNDVRFVKICIKYADIEGNSIELLKQIHGHGIGVTCAEFYITWAEKYAIDNCLKKANAVYEKGLKYSAQPLEMLEEAFRNFQAFLVRKMLNEKETFQPTVFESNSTEEVRQPYNILHTLPKGNKEVVPSVRVGTNVAGAAGVLQMGGSKETKPKNNKMIKVFEDADNCYSEADVECKIKKIQSKNRSTKENRVKPGVWTNKHNKHVPFSVDGASALPFEVHKDEEEEEEVNKKPKAVPPSVLKSHKVKADYEDENFATAPLFYPEPYDPTKKSMYCKEMVYAGGLEFQFEELRAMQYRIKREESLRNQKVADETPSESVVSQLSRVPSAVPETEQSSQSKSEDLKNLSKSPFSTPKTFESPKINLPPETEILPAATVDSSMNHTIHTKEALSEMQQLWFSKPATPISDLPKPIKTVAKSILKPSKLGFNLYVDESCLENVQPPKDSETPLNLTYKVKEPECSGADSHQKPENENCDNENIAPKNIVKRRGGKKKPLVENCKENLCIPDQEEIIDEKVGVTELKNQNEGDPEEPHHDFSSIIQCNNTAITETWNFTKGFQFPRGESTPNIRKSLHFKENFNETSFESEKEKIQEHSEKDGKTEINNEKQESQGNDKKSGFGVEGDNLRKTLSVIAETSREYRSSSSGSSGASTLTSRSSKNFPYTPSESKNIKNNLTSQTSLRRNKIQSLGCEGSNEFNFFKSPTANKEKMTLNTTLDLMTKLNAIESISVVENSKNDIEKHESGQPETGTVEDGAAQERENIDPFCSKLIDKLLKEVDFPKEQHAGGYFLLDDIKLVAPRVGGSITLGEECFNIKKTLGEGSYAKIYKLENSSSGEELIAKFQKPPCPWEFYITREVQFRIKDKNLASYFMDVESAYFFKNSSILLTKPVEYGDLLSVINKMKIAKIINQGLAMYFTAQILHILETLHSIKIIHGDIKPDNFLLRQYNNKLQIQLIDFGRGIDMSLFPEDTMFTGVVTTKGFTTVEMKLGKPWTYQIDLYGLANCGHCLLFGEYMKVVEQHGVWNITKIIPRYCARTEWKNFFFTLLNVESCSKLPNLTELRESFETILQESCEFEFNLFKLQNILSEC